MSKEKIDKEEIEFERIYCPDCGKCLCEEAIFMGKIRIKCYNCNTLVTFERVLETEEQQIKIKRGKKKKKDKELDKKT
ncbi:MAG: hypothetical protein B6D55_05020 [Candidatus Omnitrophica bacterium 4484_70.2]|nr:MAG: hypothetical protein B6D55_05020 [Candidatus Omnitrophica bacterium 4484_70.2]